jgi:RNA recognition motif-containing protein
MLLFLPQVRNIEEKLKKTKLREVLHSAFSEFGRVVSITALRSERLRGQAWITFEDIASAKAAKHEMHNKDFYGKKLVSTLIWMRPTLHACLRAKLVPRNQTVTVHSLNQSTNQSIDQSNVKSKVARLSQQ